MRCRHMLRVLALAACITQPADAQSESIAVRLIVEEETGGLFHTNFASALRNLGDVQVVPVGSPTEYQITVLVMCSGDDCGSASQYTLAVRLSAPIDSALITSLVRRNAAEGRAEAASRAVWQLVGGSTLEIQTWVLRLGRQVYEQSVRELVATINAQCFEQVRLFRRAMRTPDQVESRRLLAQYDRNRQSNSIDC